MVFPVVICACELDHKQGRMPKNLCLQSVVLEKTPECPLNSTEIKPVTVKGDQPWIFTGRTDTKAEVPVFWSSDVKRWLIGKVPDAGKDGVQKEKKVSEDEMAGWCHQCNGYELRWWGTGRPGVLQSMGLQRVRHNRETEQHSIIKKKKKLVFLRLPYHKYLIPVATIDK